MQFKIPTSLLQQNLISFPLGWCKNQYFCTIHWNFFLCNKNLFFLKPKNKTKTKRKVLYLSWFLQLWIYFCFIAAYSYFRLQICFNVFNCIHTQQNTLITATWAKRSGSKIHIFMSTRKQTWPRNVWGKNAYNETLFSFKISFTQLYSLSLSLSLLNNHLWSLEWIWQCSGTTVIIAKLLSF